MRFDSTGKIMSGDEAGHYIKILDDRPSSGGFFILTSNNPAFENCFDNWVQDEHALQRYVDEAAWQIEWLEG